MQRLPFARFAPDGLLWVGLRYLDDGELRPWGVAVIDLAVGAVAYHHESRDAGERKAGVLPVPVSTSDVAFASEDEIWMASASGATRVVARKVDVWTEADGLESELLHAVVVSPGGFVFVASTSGIGLFDGERWTFPAELRLPVNDLVMRADGVLLIATDKGVATYDGNGARAVAPGP